MKFLLNISQFQKNLPHVCCVSLLCRTIYYFQTMFFVLAQTEQGDIFKITLETDEDLVTEIRMKYFDTVPIATAMCVLKTGFLFVASEFGNQ